jgi:hypothetical protein
VTGVGLLLDFGRQFNKSPDCFSTRWKVDLQTAQTPASEMPERDKWFEPTYIIPSVTARSKPSTVRLGASAVLQPPP